jgi:osmotically-inducible protein OsmY
MADLLGYPRAGASVIEVSYARGSVTLSGTVESDAVRQALEEIARQQAGVRAAETDRITVSPLRQS